MAFLGLLHRRISFDFFLQFSWDAANPMMQRQQDPVECRQSSWMTPAAHRCGLDVPLRASYYRSSREKIEACWIPQAITATVSMVGESNNSVAVLPLAKVDASVMLSSLLGTYLHRSCPEAPKKIKLLTLTRFPLGI